MHFFLFMILVVVILQTVGFLTTYLLANDVGKRHLNTHINFMGKTKFRRNIHSSRHKICVTQDHEDPQVHLFMSKLRKMPE